MELWHEFNNLNAKEHAKEHPALFDYVREQMAAPDKQYLILGDTNHNDKQIQDFLYSPTLAALFNYASIPDICLEAPREMIRPEDLVTYRSLIKQFRNRDITLDDLAHGERDFWKTVIKNQDFWVSQFEITGDSSAYRRRHDAIEHTKYDKMPAKALQDIEDRVLRCKKDFWGKRLLGFCHASLQVEAVDSYQWRPSLVPSIAERVFLGDREVADYIKARTNNEKASVIYGSNHLNYKGALTGHLQRDKCLFIQIYSSRGAYIKSNSNLSVYADFIPDKVYLIDEGILETPATNHFRNTQDKMTDHYQQLKTVIDASYGSDARFEDKAQSRAKITMLRSTDKKYFDYTAP